MWTAQERLRWQIIAGTVALNIAILWALQISLRSEGLAAVAGYPLFIAFGLFYRFKRRMEPVAVTVIALSQVALFVASIALASYLLVGLDRPLIDDLLYSFDQSIGFDWKTAFEWTMSLPTLAMLLASAYNSTQVQIVLAIPLLGFLGYTERLDKFFLAFMLGGVATIALWAVFPSFGVATYLYTVGDKQAFAGLPQIYSFIEPQMALRAGTMTSISVADIKGVVGAPSFHTVMAIVTVSAFAGFGKWFWLLAAWNVLVVVSVPVFGGHHVADVIAGALVAWAAIVAAERLTKAMAATESNAESKPETTSTGALVAAE
jgi:membrane-associated phospholipid phosphatase